VARRAHATGSGEGESGILNPSGLGTREGFGRAPQALASSILRRKQLPEVVNEIALDLLIHAYLKTMA
jgi:hypothetical protein